MTVVYKWGFFNEWQDKSDCDSALRMGLSEMLIQTRSVGR